MQTIASQQQFSATDRELLLQLARRSLASLLLENTPLEVNPAELPPALAEPRACFVTLTSAAELRGCVGQVMSHLPLFRAVMENACGAALRDPRFPPVRAGELPGLCIEISVLSALQPLAFASGEDLLGKLEPHVHGVVLSIDGRLSTFLPQVWAQVSGKEEFMNRLSQKGGHSPSAWRQAGATVWVYSVEHFDESGPPENA